MLTLLVSLDVLQNSGPISQQIRDLTPTIEETLILQVMKKTFILLHGAWYGDWCWEELKQFLQDDEHDVVCINYPNFRLLDSEDKYTIDPPTAGSDGTASDPITLDTYIDVVKDTIDKLLEKDESTLPFIVGHSMSGIVLSNLPDEYLNKTAGLIYLTAFLLGPRDCIYQFVHRERSNNPKKGARKYKKEILLDNGKKVPTWFLTHKYIEKCFLNDCNGKTDEYLERLKTTPIPLNPIRTPIRDFSDSEAFHKVPKFYIVCKNDNAIPTEEQYKMIDQFKGRHGLKIGVEKLDSSHSPMISMPDQLSDTLKTFASQVSENNQSSI